MLYREIVPQPVLRPYIDYFWIIEKKEGAFSWEKVKLLPNGHFELTVNFGEPVLQRMGDGPLLLRPQAFIGGMYDQYFYIEPQGRLQIVGAVFLPGKLQHFLKVPAALLSGGHLSLEDLFGKRWRERYEQMGEITDLQGKLQLLQLFLTELLMPTLPKLYSNVEYALPLLYGSRGKVTISDVANFVHTSERNFRRLFKEVIGLSPKQFCRILRVKEAVDAYDTGKVANLTDLGYHCGYFDQAHFIRDFRQIAGENPGDYFLKQKGMEIRF